MPDFDEIYCSVTNSSHGHSPMIVSVQHITGSDMDSKSDNRAEAT
jgi:hypothetical protein